MRILVVSDTHGDTQSFKKVLDNSRDAEVVIHCGDGAAEVEYLRSYYPEKMFISVKGNCDLCCEAPNVEVRSIEGKKLFITHGNMYGVKSGLYTLSCAARQEGADIAIFGHTHVPCEIYDDGLYLFNPGSLRGYGGSYGYIDISPKGVLTNIVRKN